MTEAEFLAAIEASLDEPLDQRGQPARKSPMLVFADWLEEHGDPTAAAWRWIAARRRKPRQIVDWHWEVWHVDDPTYGPHRVKPHVFKRLQPEYSSGTERACYNTRIDAYVDLARAYAEAKAAGEE